MWMEFFNIGLENISKTGIIISIFAFLIGVRYPDWDFKMGLKHRSAFTHSPLIVYLLYTLHKNSGGVEFRYFLISFSIAVGIHLVYDYFPKKWIGSALVHLSFKIVLGSRYSKLFFAFSILFCNYIAIKMMENSSEYIAFFIIGLLIFFKESKKEAKFFRPLFLYALVYCGLGYFKYCDIFNWVVEPVSKLIKMSLKA